MEVASLNQMIKVLRTVEFNNDSYKQVVLGMYKMLDKYLDKNINEFDLTKMPTVNVDMLKKYQDEMISIGQYVMTTNNLIVPLTRGENVLLLELDRQYDGKFQYPLSVTKEGDNENYLSLILSNY